METADTQSSQLSGYLREASTNRIGPKDGLPMQVVEFSLTNEARDQLHQALRPYTYGKRKKPVDFGKIIEETLPSEILDELRHYVSTRGLSTVYVIRNLIETLPEHTNESLQTPEGRKEGWTNEKRYMQQVSLALTDALHLERRNEASYNKQKIISRHHDNKTIFGCALHSHSEHITMLGGVLSDGAKTRFVDGRVLHEQDEEKDGGEYSALLPDCSQDVLIDQGALAIWANDGEILHQALKTPEDVLSATQKNKLLRVAIRTFRDRPLQHS